MSLMRTDVRKRSLYSTNNYYEKPLKSFSIIPCKLHSYSSSSTTLVSMLSSVSFEAMLFSVSLTLLLVVLEHGALEMLI